MAWLRRVVVGGRSGLSAARATLPLLVGQRGSAAAHGMAGAVWPVRARLRQKRPSRAPALNVRGPAQGRVLVWCGAARRASCVVRTAVPWAAAPCLVLCYSGPDPAPPTTLSRARGV